MSNGGAQTTSRNRFKPYPDYKDSGVEWLGEIPADWSVRRLKTLISEPITDGPHETPDFLIDGVPFLSVDGIQEGELVFEGCRYISEAAHREYRRKCAPRRDDILLGKAASTGKIARVKVDFEFGVWSPLALIRPNEVEVWPTFLEYALKSMATQAQIDVLCTSSTQKNISMRDIPILVVCLAGLQEQRAIASFLDLETAKIDALVAKKERLILLLQEKRTSLITRAVTKGLDPNVPMKESDVEWLGDIPAHWEVKRVRDIAESLQTGPFGSQLHADEYVTGECPVINPANLRDGQLVPDWDCTVDEATARRLEHHRLAVDDILLARRGELGRCGLVTQQEKGWVCGTGSLRLRTRRDLARPRFLTHLLSTSGVRDWLQLQSVGSTMRNLNTSIIGRIPVALPIQAEQDEIVTRVDLETGRIDSLIAKVRDGIDRLKEYRTALISYAVTGKIDVRGEIA